MITTSKIGERTVYMTDNEKERRRLADKGEIVYDVKESHLFSEHPDVLDEDFRALLFQLKSLAPHARVIGVET